MWNRIQLAGNYNFVRRDPVAKYFQALPIK
jgi:hypothetical protein